MTRIHRAQASPFRAGLARSSGRALLADVGLERLQGGAAGRGGEVRPGGGDPWRALTAPELLVQEPLPEVQP